MVVYNLNGCTSRDSFKVCGLEFIKMHFPVGLHEQIPIHTWHKIAVHTAINEAFVCRKRALGGEIMSFELVKRLAP